MELPSTILASLGVATALTLSCATAQTKTKPDPDLAGARRAAAASNAFAFDLYKRVVGKDGNVFFSPYSIAVALAMTQTGARGNTATEMAKVMHNTGLDLLAEYPRLTARLPYRGRGKGHDVSVANALWGQQGMAFEAPFLSGLDQRFRAPLRRLDFAENEKARTLINEWVAKQTKKRIQKIVPPGLPTPDTRLVLGNAIHFKAAWHEDFAERATQPHKFTTAAGKAMQVSMMQNVDYFEYAEVDGVQLVVLPFAGYQTAMLIALPRKAKDLPAVEKSLSAKAYAKWTKNFKRPRVHVKLPKFKFEMPLNLGETLEKMGMKDAFAPRRADFSGMTKQEPLFIGAVLHKAFIDVHEKGVEAAAATMVMMAPGAAARPAEPIPFVCDRPFLFFIAHLKTRCILFAGRVTAPTAAKN